MTKKGHLSYRHKESSLCFDKRLINGRLARKLKENPVNAHANQS